LEIIMDLRSSLPRLCWAIGLTACSGLDTPDQATTLACNAAALIGGTEAPARALDAIGALGTVDEQGNYHTHCSATLIASDLVLTAKHCTMTQNGGELRATDVFFAVGFDSDRPIARVRALEGLLSAPERGGVSELGSDVAVYRLERPLPSVQPFAVSPLRLSDLPIGETLAVYGYGPAASDCSGEARARRRRGTLALGAHRGNVFDFIYGDRSGFIENAARDTPAIDLDARYHRGELLDGYEGWGFDAEAASQTCHGDSGGPVLLESGATPELIGITSWSWRSNEQLCAYGTVFAIFGPDARDFLRRAMQTMR
jgi:hypothetical protein